MTVTKKYSLLGLILLLGVPGVAASAEELELSIGVFRVRAEVAADPATRAQGLMYRQSLSANRGMVFVFDTLDRHCMWMANTLIPLSVAFLDDKGRILNVEEMQAQTRTPHCAAKPARFALEMNAGWFASRAVPIGQVVAGVEALPSAR